MTELTKDEKKKQMDAFELATQVVWVADVPTMGHPRRWSKTGAEVTWDMLEGVRVEIEDGVAAVTTAGEEPIEFLLTGDLDADAAEIARYIK